MINIFRFISIMFKDLKNFLIKHDVLLLMIYICAGGSAVIIAASKKNTTLAFTSIAMTLLPFLIMIAHSIYSYCKNVAVRVQNNE